MRLIETTQKYVCETEIEAKDTIESFRAEAARKGYTIKKASYERKTKKAKGVIIAEAFVTTIVMTFGGVWDELEVDE